MRVAERDALHGPAIRQRSIVIDLRTLGGNGKGAREYQSECGAAGYLMD
jgi:hypothetical protein